MNTKKGVQSLEGVFHIDCYICMKLIWPMKGVVKNIMKLIQGKGCFTMNVIKLIQSMEGVFHNKYYKLDSVNGRDVLQ